MKAAIAVIVAVALAGCANGFETRPYDSAKDSVSINGVKYYEPKVFKVSYTLTTLIDNNGNLKGTAANNTCAPVLQKQELVVMPDYANPRVLINKPALLSSGKLGITMDKGMLTSVNVDTASETGTLITAAGTVIAAALPVIAALAPPTMPACNGSPEISSVTPQDL